MTRSCEQIKETAMISKTITNHRANDKKKPDMSVKILSRGIIAKKK